MERILITGANGLLGQKCITELKSDYELYLCDVHDASFLDKENIPYFVIDITKRQAVKNAITSLKPHYIVNAAAYTDVDGCETSKELCWKTNVEAVDNLVYAALKTDSKIIHISSDYIFDGKNGPYQETDVPSPLGYYGKSKLAGENVLIRSNVQSAILRTMILYGVGIKTRPNFVTWLINEIQNERHVKIVNDQYGNPTLADDLARAIKRVIDLEKWDIFHVSGSQLIDRYHFAVRIAETFDLNPEYIVETTTTELAQVALRPLRSGFMLDKIKTELGLKMMTIDESLKVLKKQMKKLKLI